MNFIFIEAKNSNTSEYNFIKTILDNNFADKDKEIVCMDGVDNLLFVKICIKIGGIVLRIMKNVFKAQRMLKINLNTIYLIVRQNYIHILVRSS